MSRTLNPFAQPFHINIPSLTAEPGGGSHPMLPHEICGGHVERQARETVCLPPQEPMFPLLYVDNLQLMVEVFLPVSEPTGAVGGFWYTHPHAAAYQPFCTPQPVNSYGVYRHQLVNQETLVATRGSDHRAGDNRISSVGRKMSAKRNGWCPRKFPLDYGRKKTVTETEWRPKGSDGKPAERSTGGCAAVRRPVVPFPPTLEEAESSQTTTVMIKNIPNQYQFKDLLLILDDYCSQQNNKTADRAVWSKFDFVYLPMDYRKHSIEGRLSNLGYAFVNFTTAGAAYKFYQRFQGLVWNVTENKKTCEITTAEFQGKEALMRIFDEKVFRCTSRDFLPVVFPQARDGFNRRMKGITVGKHVWGLPRKCIGR